jgi:hypothetical protein
LLQKKGVESVSVHLPGGVVFASCSIARAIQRQVAAPSGSPSASS